MNLKFRPIIQLFLILLFGLSFKLNANDCGFAYDVDAVLLSGSQYQVTASYQLPADQTVSLDITINGDWMDYLSGQDGTATYTLSGGEYQICFDLNESLPDCPLSFCKTIQLGGDCDAAIEVSNPGTGVYICNLDGAAINSNIDWTLTHISGAEISAFTGMYFYFSLAQSGTYEICAAFSLADGSCYGYSCETINFSEETCPVDFDVLPLNYSGAFQFSSISEPATGAMEVQYAWYFDTMAIIIGEDAEVSFQFPEEGVYQVCHTVVYKNSFGELICSGQYCKSVQSPPTCTFNLELEQNFQSLSVQAVNLSNYLQGNFLYEIIHEGDTLLLVGQQNLMLSFPSSGFYDIYLHFQSFDGVCSHSAHVPANVGGNNEDCLVDFSWSLYEESSSGQFGIVFNNTSGLETQSLSWDFGDGYTVEDIQNNQIVHFYTEPGIYFVCLSVITTDDCTSYFCQQVVFDPFDNICDFIDCVMPGDANYDGTVDIVDVLAIGLGYGSNGHNRPLANHSWTPQQSLDWNKTVGEHTFDYKHIDTDGSGVIDSADLIALDLNYGNTHDNLGIDKPMSPDAEPMVFVDIVAVSEESIGNFVHYNVSADFFVGTDDMPAQNLYGIAMSLHYSVDLPTEAIVAEVTHIDNVLTGNGAYALLYYKHLPELQRIDLAIVRTDQQNASANSKQRVARGEITLIGDIIGKPDGESNDWDVEVPFTIEVLWVHAINNLGENLQYFGHGDETILTVISNAQNLIADEKVLIVPNPSHGQIQLINPGLQFEKISVFNSLGQLVHVSNPGKGYQTIYPLELTGLPSGQYVVRIQTESGLLIQRFTIL